MKRIILATLVALALAVGPALTLSGAAYAACGSSNNENAKGQVLNGIGQTSHDCSDKGVTNTLGTVVNILSLVVGAVAIIAIINGGFKYIMSGGDATKVTNAKHTIIYALVGIVVVVLAQFIVRVVVTETSDASHGCKSGQHFDSASNACVTN